MESNAPNPATAKQISPWIVVAITLACVLVFEKAVSFLHSWDYGARAKRSEALLAGQEQRAQRVEDYYKHIEEDERRTRAVLDRQEKNTQRLEQILATWERQQKEYQAYLDSLKKPQ
jgi:hypothetical protein